MMRQQFCPRIGAPNCTTPLVPAVITSHTLAQYSHTLPKEVLMTGRSGSSVIAKVRSGSRWRGLLAAVGMALAVFMTVRLTRLSFYDVGVASSVWWPASGLALAALVRAPRRWWPALVLAIGVGNGAANLVSGSPTAASGFALANMVEVTITALVVTRGHGPRLSTQRQTGVFLAGAAAAVLAAGVLVAIRCLIDGTSWWPVSRGYVLAHAVGLIALTPLLLPDGVLSYRPAGRRAEALLHVAVTGGIGWWAFLAPAAGGRAFLAVIPLIWAARRLGALQATQASLVLVIMAAAGTVHGEGTFAAITDPLSRLLSAQLFTACISIVTLVLVIAEVMRHRLDDELADRTLVLQDTVDATSTGMALVAFGENLGQVLMSNVSFRRTLAGSADSAVSDLAGLVSAADEPALRAALQDLADGAERQLTLEVRPRDSRRAETVVRMSLTVTPQRIHGRRAVVSVQDITDQRERETALSLQASTDPLTQLVNRRALHQELAIRLARLDPASVLAVLFVDLNGFKTVNDTFGHAVGDQVLAETARRLTATVRPSDVVGRLGGDEFLVVCGGLLRQSDLALIASRIVDSVRAPMAIADGPVLSIGASIGTAVAQVGMTVEHLLDLADGQMYLSKRSRVDEVDRVRPEIA